MSQDIRRELIGKNLGIKPINHGQIYTFQIALPDARKQPILLEKRQAIEKSFVAHQSNLISLIVRRTEAYDDEDIEYELVHGAEWLQIAQELEIEKVWAWVFDMTDEQAIATIREMELLTAVPSGSSPLPSTTDTTPSASSSDLSTLIDQKLQLAAESIKHSLTVTLNGIREDLNEKLKVVNYRLDTLQSSNSDLSGLTDVLDKLDSIQQRLASGRRSTLPPFDGVQINLLEASDDEIERVLAQVGTQPRQIKGAIAAIHHWKHSEQGLTWHNLELSAKAKTGSPYKINGFAQGTCDRLRIVATIPEST